MVKVHTLRDLPGPNGRSYSPFEIATGSSSNNRTPLISFRQTNYDGTTEDSTCLKVFCPGFKLRSFTFIITVIQVLMFIISKIYSWYLAQSTDSDWAWTCSLYRLGSKHVPSMLIYHQFYRLVSPAILHGGHLHIAMNMLSQGQISYSLENQYGTKRFAILYILAAMGGNLLSSFWTPTNLGIGASTSLFGVLALRCLYVLENYDSFGPAKSNVVISTGLTLLMNVMFLQFVIPNIDNEGHAGGFFIGVVVGLQYIKWESDRKFHVKQKIAMWFAIFWAVATMIYLFTLKSSLKGEADVYYDYCPFGDNSFYDYD